MSRENTSPPAGKEKFSCIQPPAIHRGCFFAEALFASIRTSRFHCICSAFIPSWLRLPSSAVSTMVLSETRGLWLCWVVRGCIQCLLRLAAYLPDGYLPSNPSAQRPTDRTNRNLAFRRRNALKL